jgi:hypothetical protein
LAVAVARLVEPVTGSVTTFLICAIPALINANFDPTGLELADRIPNTSAVTLR